MDVRTVRGGWCVSAVVAVRGVISAGADFYRHGRQALIHHWQKRRANSGNYVEKNVL